MKLFSVLAGLASTEAGRLPINEGPLCDWCKLTAVADFNAGSGDISGQITFTESGCDSDVHISGVLTWSNDSDVRGDTVHGWHIHNWGQTSNGCGAEFTGDHFNPYNSSNEE